jgi:hypothetical protein
MTPKSKAKELISRFNNSYDEESKSYILYQNVEESKRCALIAVDEILDLNLGLSNCDEENWAIDKFYLEVKQEIKKIMTPKEKAEKLFKQYYSYLKANLMNDREAWEDAKECALIAVNLAIEVETNIFKAKVQKSYWQEVKKEIENL